MATIPRSIPLSEATKRRLAELSRSLHRSYDELIERALDAMEGDTFWDGWDEEAAAYLAQHGDEETTERTTFAGTSADGIGF